MYSLHTPVLSRIHDCAGWYTDMAGISYIRNNIKNYVINAILFEMPLHTNLTLHILY